MPPLCIAHIRSGDRVMIGGFTNFGARSTSFTSLRRTRRSAA